MKKKFKDTTVTYQQEYLCAVLYSLASLADAYKRYCNSDGVIRNNCYHEIVFHHELAVKTVLRMFSFGTGRTFATAHNIEQLWQNGLQGFEDFIRENKKELDIE